MKIQKTAALLLSAVLLCSLAACNGNTGDDTTVFVPEATDESITQASFAEMSPETMEMTVPDGLALDFNTIDMSSAEEIAVADSCSPAIAADKVMKNGDMQYFWLSNEKFSAVSTTEGNEYVIYYGKDYIAETFADSDRTLYLKKDGSVSYGLYRYTVELTKSDVVSYYAPDGNRIGMSKDGSYCTDDFEYISEEDFKAMIASYTAEETTSAQQETTAQNGSN